MEKQAVEIMHHTHTLQQAEIRQDMDGETNAREQAVLNREEK